MVRDPGRPMIYATTSVNTVIAINTTTLTMTEVAMGTAPSGLDISPDGTKLYVANSGATAPGISIIDLTTFQVSGGLTTPFQTRSVVSGLNGHLYICGTYSNPIVQLDSTTGAVQATLKSISDSIDKIQRTPDRTKLFGVNFGISPSSLYAMDISGSTVTLTQSSPFDTVGENGEDLIISPDGSALVFPNGGGQANYEIFLIPTSNISGVIGSFHLGPYPVDGAFSPDGALFYTAPNASNKIQAWSTSTFRLLGTASATDLGRMITDQTGKYLFAGTTSYPGPGTLKVYSTGAGVYPFITSNLNLTVDAGLPVHYPLTANLAGVTWSATGLPAGLTLDSSSGLITGKTSVGGSFTANISATLPGGGTTTAKLSISVTVLPTTVPAAGATIATFGRNILTMIRDRNRPLIYAATGDGTVLAINTNSLLPVWEIPVGSILGDMDISLDGTRLYVANSRSTSQGIAVIDLDARQALAPVPTPFLTSSVTAGLNGHLYILPAQEEGAITQIDSTTGAVQASVGWSSVDVYSGKLLRSLDAKTLFYGDFGLSPSELYALDISGATLKLTQKTPFDTVGENGEDLILNADGSALIYPNGGGQSGYQIALISTSNINSVLGLYNVSAYPTNGAFSPDGSTFYADPATQTAVQIWNAKTFTKTGSFPATYLDHLLVDNSGSYLFATVDTPYGGGTPSLIVYATGQGAPPVITGSSSLTVDENAPVNFTLSPAQSGLLWSSANLPAGLALDRQSGVITGAVATPGTYNIQVTALGAGGHTAQGTLNLTVLTSLTVQVSGNGAVSGASAGVNWVALGSAYTLTATPDPLNRFTSWTGSVTSPNTTISGTVTADMTITANFAPIPTLTVNVVGPGTIPQAFLGTTTPDLGSLITIPATAAAGAEFLGWSGDIVSSQYTLSFTLTKPTVITANFVALASFVGSYDFALATPPSSGPPPKLMLVVQPAGNIAGTVIYNGQSFKFSGDFPAATGYTRSFTTKTGQTFALQLALRVDSGTPEITATITTANTSFALDGYRNLPAGQVASRAGKYTFYVPPPAGNETLGYGYGTVNITKSGQVIFSGFLGDGTPLRSVAPLCDAGYVPLDVAPAAGGYLSGIVQFRDVANQSDFDGQLNWKCTDGTQFTVQMLGSKYAPPSSAAGAFHFTSAHVTFAHDGLDQPVAWNVTLGTKNKLTAAAPHGDDFKCTFTPSTGIFAGSAILPGNAGPVTFKGVAFQKNPSAEGYFKSGSAVGCGTFRLDPDAN